MVAFVITDYIRKRTAYSPESVYDYLTDNTVFGFDELDAIEASSWCELAYVGESYTGDGFYIEVKEE